MVIGQRFRTRVIGAIGLAFIVGVIGLALAIYQKTFVSSVDVELTTDRAGLLLDKGAKVQAFGLPIGDVRSVELQPDNSVVVKMAIDPEQAKRIPKGVAANILATTVFGQKYVQFDVPEGEVATPIGDGDKIRNLTTSVEVNDVFEQLQAVLTAVDPGRLATTLTSVATALDRRGEDLGNYLTQLNTYVTALNGRQGVISEDLERGAEVVDTLADVTPELLDIARNVTVTSKTLTDNEATLHALLIDLRTAANDGTSLGLGIEQPLDELSARLRPTTALLRDYRKVLNCTIHGFVEEARLVNLVAGNDVPGIQGSVSLLPAQRGYKFPDNLPKLVTANQPNCFNLPSNKPLKGEENGKPPHRYFDDGTGGFFNGPAKPTLGPIQLYGDLIKDFFGDSGLALLLGQTGADQ